MAFYFELGGVPVGMVALHLISVTFNGKRAISGTDLCHSAALVCGVLEIFSERFQIYTLAWNGNERTVHGCSDGGWGHIWSSTTVRNGDELFATEARYVADT